MATAMVTDIWAAADAVTITVGEEAAVTATIITGKSSLPPPIARAKSELQRRERVAPSGRGRFCEFRGSSAQPHLDRDPDQVRMILGAELPLEQGRGVGNGLVGDVQRVGDFD